LDVLVRAEELRLFIERLPLGGLLTILILLIEAGLFELFLLFGGWLVVLWVLSLGRGLATLGALSLLLGTLILGELTTLDLRVLHTDAAELHLVAERVLRSFIGRYLLFPGLRESVNAHDAEGHLGHVEGSAHSGERVLDIYRLGLNLGVPRELQ